MPATGDTSPISNSRPTARTKRMIVINRDLQLRYTGAAVLVGTMTTALTTFFILLPLYVFKILVIPRFLPWPILLVMGLALVMNIFSVFILGLIMTNRIAGPLYALIRSMRTTGRGDFTAHLGVRSTDDLKYVVRHFNDMTASLSRMTKDDMEVVDTLIKNVNELHNRFGSEPEQQENAHVVLHLMKDLQEFKIRLNARVEAPLNEGDDQ
ncbi:MAG: methyl-accepting chemotaxis protein [Proteobacteria bacterium]|nr:methyl-accepting chemotaxis protein [Pseudomonadota bacterium]